MSSGRASLSKNLKSSYFEGSKTFFSSENENPQNFPQNDLFFPHFPRASLLPHFVPPPHFFPPPHVSRRQIDRKKTIQYYVADIKTSDLINKVFENL